MTPGTVCVVQARTGSSRLPGKVLAEIDGVPALGFMLRRLRPLPWPTVVATTEAGADDPVADLAQAEGVEVVRGDEDDVLSRFALVLDRHPADEIVRLTGDCPLVDPEVVRAAVALRRRTDAAYASNALVRTFPDGLDVEVVAAEALRAAAEEAVDPVEREHVTTFVQRHPERFALRTLRHDEPLGHLRWTVDTEADLDRVRRIVGAVGAHDFPWTAALSHAEARDGATPLVVDRVALRPAMPSEADEAFLFALRNDEASVRWSRSGRPVTPAEHAAWFGAAVDDPSTRIWIGEEAGASVGEVRVDVEAAVGLVSIAVAPEARGRGVGAALLRGLGQALAADHQVVGLVADVHDDNEASRRLFERAGFTEAHRDPPFTRLVSASVSRY